MYNTLGEFSGTERRRADTSLQAAITEIPRPTLVPRVQPALWQIDVPRVVRWLRGGMLLIAAAAILLALVGVGYSIVTRPRFTAHAAIVVDPSNLQVVPDDIYAQSQQRDSQLLEVESMLSVLTSGNTLSRVVNDLDLSSDPEFVKSAGVDVAGMFGLSSGGGTPRPASATALEALATRIKAVRDDGSFVVDVNLWSEDPDKSVRIVNALVAAFQAELAQEEAEGAQRSVSSLTDQLTQLKRNVADAEDAVETFKRTHNLQQTNGEMTSAQSMTQLNAQVTDAQARLIAAQARYDSLTRTGSAGASTDALQSATMTALRTQYATLKQQYDSAAATLGKLHPTMLQLAQQVKAAEAQMNNEIARTVAAAKSEVDAAHSALTALTAQTATARSSVATDDQAQVQLRELQREADSRTAIYQAYLTRADQLAQRQQIDTTNVRVISPPLLPTRSWPPGPLLAGAAGIFAGALLGMVLAAALGFLRDYRSMKAAAGKWQR